MFTSPHRKSPAGLRAKADHSAPYTLAVAACFLVITGCQSSVAVTPAKSEASRNDTRPKYTRTIQVETPGVAQ